MLQATMIKDKNTRNDAYFVNNEKKNPIKVLNKYDINEFITNLLSFIQDAIENYTKNGSRWSFYAPVRLYIKITPFQTSVGGKYVKLPTWIENKKCAINI